MIDGGEWSNWWIENWQWKLKYADKTCPSATLSIPQIPHNKTRARTWAAAVESQ
jgi:hypothetical protein